MGLYTMQIVHSASKPWISKELNEIYHTFMFANAHHRLRTFYMEYIEYRRSTVGSRAEIIRRSAVSRHLISSRSTCVPHVTNKLYFGCRELITLKYDGSYSYCSFCCYSSCISLSYRNVHYIEYGSGLNGSPYFMPHFWRLGNKRDHSILHELFQP